MQNLATEKDLKRYKVGIRDLEVIIIADEVKYDDMQLKFIKNNEVIAVFIAWSYWICLGKVVDELEKFKRVSG